MAFFLSSILRVFFWGVASSYYQLARFTNKTSVLSQKARAVASVLSVRETSVPRKSMNSDSK